LERAYRCALRLIGGNSDSEQAERFLRGPSRLQKESPKTGNCAAPTALSDVQADWRGSAYELIGAGQCAWTTKGMGEHGASPRHVFSYLNNS